VKFFVIGDEDTVLGFSLAGADGIVVHDATSARRALDETMEREEIGIIIITERVATMIRDEVNAYFYQRAYPLIVEIPDRLGPLEERVSVRDVIQTAVGIRLE